MKSQKTYEVDTETLEAFDSTEKSLKDLKPSDRIEYHRETINLLVDLVHQCRHIGGVLGNDDLMVSIPEKEYEHLFKDVKDVSLHMLGVCRTFAKRVPSRSEDSKHKTKSENPLVS
jgi:hypothetical protein